MAATKKPASKVPSKPAAKKVATPKATPAVSTSEQDADIKRLLQKTHEEAVGSVATASVEQTDSTQIHPVATVAATVSPAIEEPVVEVKDILMIARKECMSCSHLCPEVGKTPYVNCHYDAGNEDCPAKTTVIMVGMSQSEVEKAANAIVEATDNSDFKRLARAAEKLATKSEAVRSVVSKRVLEIQADRAQA